VPNATSVETSQLLLLAVFTVRYSFAVDVTSLMYLGPRSALGASKNSRKTVAAATLLSAHGHVVTSFEDADEFFALFTHGNNLYFRI